MRNKLGQLILLCLLCQLALAFTSFKDVTANHPAYDSVSNVVNVYGIMSGFSDNTFRGQENINRYQFAGILNSSLAYLERISGRNLMVKTSSQDKFSDVPVDHWASKAVDNVANRYQVMGGFSDSTFQGQKTLTRLELSVILGKIVFKIEGKEKYTVNPYFEDVDRKHWAFKYVQKLVDMRMIAAGGRLSGDEPVSRYEVALAMDMFLQKLAPMLQSALPTEVKSAIVYPDVPIAIEARWGGVIESASQTENWLFYGLGISTWRGVNLFGRNVIWELGLQFNSNPMIYLDAANPYNYNSLWENRYLAKLMTNFLLSPQLALTLGFEYLSLNNSFSPSSYLGLAFGGLIKANLPCGLNPDIKLTYSTPFGKLESVPSSLGAPSGRFYFELAQEFGLLGTTPQFVISVEDLLMGDNKYSRFYDTFGLRFKL